MSVILFPTFGAIGILLFHEGLLLPVSVSVTVLGLAALQLDGLYRQSRVGPLIVLLFAAYALPFIHIVPYIWFDFDADPPLILWGLATNPYMTDRAIIELTAMIGAVGAAGFITGVSITRGKYYVGRPGRAMTPFQPFEKTLSLPVFSVWVAAAILFSWMNAPSDTLLSVAYAESATLNADWNFGSAWMFSYALMVFVLADSMFEASRRIAALKGKIVLGATLLIVIWFQLLRGDRESLTFVLAALLMYYVWGKDLRRSKMTGTIWNQPMLVMLALLVFVVSFVVGAMRFDVVGINSVDDFLNVWNRLVEAEVIRFDNLVHGTWSAVLLTPLSVAGDYLNDELSFKYGHTYLDLLVSIVPGFVADWIGFVRPIDALQGPAWEMSYGMGGTHAAVVPFMNFGMEGVLVIVALWALVLAKLERYSMRQRAVPYLALAGVIATTIPHWLWYGEKYIMNALIIWLVLSLLYRIRLQRDDATSVATSSYQLSNRRS